MESSEDIYRFDPERTHQGLAVLIVNFTSGTYKRSGAINDLKYMKKTFKRLGFKVKCHTDVKKSELETLLTDYSKDEDLSKYSCFAFGISSHGVEEEFRVKEKVVNHHAIETFDRKYFYTKNIIDKFSHQNCRALRNRPKLFFIQACRIPLEKTSKDHYDGGVGFDPGSVTQKHVNPGQGSSGDQKDVWSSEDEDSVEEDVVSDTDDEGDQLPSAAANPETFNENQEGIGEVVQDLERRQLEIVDNLKRLNNEAYKLRRAYALAANQIKDQNFNASANQNKEQSAQLAANQNEENEPQLSPNQNKEQSSALVSGDEVDPAKGRQMYPSGDIHIVSVPCDKDMIVMFASPQGHYAIRNKTEGSYMLKYLYEVVEEHYGNGRLNDNQTSFLDVLVGVAARMAEGTYMGEKMYTIVPCLVHKLSKDVIFMQGKKMFASKFLLKVSELFMKRDGTSYFMWSYKSESQIKY